MKRRVFQNMTHYRYVKELLAYFRFMFTPETCWAKSE